MPALEEIGIQPVPREHRTGTWHDLFAVIFAFGINPLYFVLGAIAVPDFDLPLWWAVGLAVAAQLVSYGVLVIVSQVGSDHGIPGQVSLRALFAGLAHVHLPIVPVSIGLTALQALLAIAGFDVLRWTTRVVLPLGIAFVVLALVVQSLAVNIGNAYSVGMSIANVVPLLGRLRATAAGACAGSALAAFPSFLTSASLWITRLGNIATPLAAVVLVDYLHVQRQRLDTSALYEPRGRYRYVGGFNVAAVTAITAGVVAYSLVPGPWLKAAWGVGVAAAAYAVLQPLQRRRLEVAGSADGMGDAASATAAGS